MKASPNTAPQRYASLRWLVFFALVVIWPPVVRGEIRIRLRPFVTGLLMPVYLTHAGDGSGRLFIVEQRGRILVTRRGDVPPALFLDIRGRVLAGGERGLLSVAFHPRFADNGRFFVNYTARDSRSSKEKTVIAEYRVSPGQPDRAQTEERVVLEVTQPFQNHNGGQVQFGPDGYLYIGMGDGGYRDDPYGNGQNTSTLLGALLRIDVDGAKPYAVPPDNPFVDREGADEMWAYGLRNPWRFSFDRATGRLFLADVGQNDFEEIDLITRGGNYGWNRMEAGHCFPPRVSSCETNSLILPIAEYAQTEGKSVTGGYVYRGSAIPELDGTYLFGDYTSHTIWGLRETASGQWSRRKLLRAPERISSFGEDAEGELYVVGYRGTIFKIEPAETPPFLPSGPRASSGPASKGRGTTPPLSG